MNATLDTNEEILNDGIQYISEKIACEGGKIEQNDGRCGVSLTTTDQDTGGSDAGGIGENIEVLVENAEGETVTPESLTECSVLPVLDQEEQPHHLLKGNALLIQRGGEVETKGGAAGSVVTVVTDKRVLCNIETRGIISIPYDSITSVEYGLPPEDEWELNIPLLGEFSGQTEKLIINSQGRTYYLDLSERFGVLPDSLVEQDDEEHAELVFDVINYIRNNREEFKNQSQSSESNTTDSDPLDQIERLKELNEQGAISDEEFEEKKSDLLDRI